MNTNTWMNKFVLWFTYAAICVMMILPVAGVTAQVKSAGEVQTVTLNMKKASLPDILSEIEKQAGITFSYESSLLKDLPKTNFKAVDETLDDCLSRLFAGYPIVYVMKGKIVVLKRKPRQVTIRGCVRDKVSAESLIGASVYELNSYKGVATDTYGFFTLVLEVPSEQANPVQLHASYIGYESQTFRFHSLMRDTILTIDLQPNASLDEVLVTGTERTNQTTVRNTQMGTIEVDKATIRSTPTLFGEADIIRTLQLTPGVSLGTEAVSGLYVRGGNGDDNLFLIDGNPVYQVSHIGGIFSAFNAEAIKGMDFYKAGFPARYGGRLSSVVDVHTREGNNKEFHGSASLGLISGALSLEGPIIKDKTSFLIALRRSWLDVLTVPAMHIANRKMKKDGMKSEVRYAFHDLNARIDHHFNDRSHLYLSIYNGNDVLKVGSEDFSRPYENYFSDKTDVSLRWGNLLATAGWHYDFNDKLSGRFSGFYSRYRSKINYLQDNTHGREGEENYSNTFDETTNYTGINDFGIRAAFDYQPNYKHHIRFGGEAIAHRFRPEYYRTRALDTDLPDSLQMDHVLADQTLWAQEAAAYAEDDWTLSPSLRLNAGLRLSLFHIDRKVYAGLEPRLSLRWLVHPDISLKASYARMSQYVHLITNSFLSLPTDSWMPVTSRLKPLISDQLSLGGYYSWNHTLDFSIEGYYKRMHNLLEYKDGYGLVPSTVSWDNKLTAGDGRAYGAEFMVRKPKGRTTGWIGYTLAWADRRFDEINEGRRFPSRYDNRHKLNIVVMHKLTPKVELSAAWTYSSGNYTTLSLESYEEGGYLHNSSLDDRGYGYGRDREINYYDKRNNYQLPAYHRLDLGINIYRPKKKGRMGIWNISIYNAYCRMNTLLVFKDKDYDYDYDNMEGKTVNKFRKAGIMPIIPSITYTYKF